MTPVVTTNLLSANGWQRRQDMHNENKDQQAGVYKSPRQLQRILRLH